MRCSLRAERQGINIVCPMPNCDLHVVLMILAIVSSFSSESGTVYDKTLAHCLGNSIFNNSI